jgi:hypothetical protein
LESKRRTPGKKRIVDIPPRYNSRPHGDCIGDLVAHRGSTGLKEKGNVGIEEEDMELSRAQWSWRRCTSQRNPDELWLFRFPLFNGWAEGPKGIDPFTIQLFFS